MFGCLAKWALKLSEFNIAYHLKPSQKAQVLANFQVECTNMSGEHEETSLEHPVEPLIDKMIWVLHVDGASNTGGSRAGLILANPDRVMAECALCFLFKATNNQAEYETLITGLRTSRKLGVSSLRVFIDSQLVASQVSGEFDAQDP